MKYTGIILAGGKSTRMLTDKGLVKIGNRPMVEYVINTLKPLCNQIIISSNNPNYQQFGYPVVRDEIPLIGPLGGIVSSLNHSKNDWNFVLSCDLPFLKARWLTVLTEYIHGYQIIATQSPNKIHPLCSLFHVKTKDQIYNQIKKEDYKMTNLFKVCPTHLVHLSDYGYDERMVSNINSQNDLYEAL